MAKRLYLDDPNIGEAEKRSVCHAIDAGYVSTFGPFVSKFEDAFARRIGAKRAVSVQNGTAAIHVALIELGIGPGDEVIVPDLTFVATVSPVIYVGAKPVFADVDRSTWNIDPVEIEKKITARTKAIIPVHFYGNPCDMGRIMEIAKRHNIRVIEDATESLGATYKGRCTGTIGDFGCFSFNGNKIITTGGGGMVVGSNNRRLEHIKFLVNQARDSSLGYFHPEVGFNYRMTNIEASMGLAQLKRLDGFLTKKRAFAEIYHNELRDISSIRFQEFYEDAESSHWFTCFTVRNIDVVKLQKKLAESMVPTRRVFMPLTEFPPYRPFKRDSYRSSYHIYQNGLCLPASTKNSAEDIYRVCGILRKALPGHGMRGRIYVG